MQRAVRWARVTATVLAWAFLPGLPALAHAVALGARRTSSAAAAEGLAAHGRRDPKDAEHVQHELAWLRAMGPGGQGPGQAEASAGQDAHMLMREQEVGDDDNAHEHDERQERIDEEEEAQDNEDQTNEEEEAEYEKRATTTSGPWEEQTTSSFFAEEPSEAVSEDTEAGFGEGVVRYGPGGCVSTWKSKASHCIIRTDCRRDQRISDYVVKLMCVDKAGEKVRHVFGPGSFDPQETFDTLIVCDQCGAGDDEYVPIPGNITPEEFQEKNNTLSSLVKEVDAIKANLIRAADAVKQLNQTVFAPQTTSLAPPSPWVQSYQAPSPPQPPGRIGLVRRSSRVSSARSEQEQRQSLRATPRAKARRKGRTASGPRTKRLRAPRSAGADGNTATAATAAAAEHKTRRKLVVWGSTPPSHFLHVTPGGAARAPAKKVTADSIEQDMDEGSEEIAAMVHSSRADDGTTRHGDDSEDSAVPGDESATKAQEQEPRNLEVEGDNGESDSPDPNVPAGDGGDMEDFFLDGDQREGAEPQESDGGSDTSWDGEAGDRHMGEAASDSEGGDGQDDLGSGSGELDTAEASAHEDRSDDYIDGFD